MLHQGWHYPVLRKASEHVIKKHLVEVFAQFGGVPMTPEPPILLQKHRDTNERRIVIQIGGVYTTFFQEESTLLLNYRYTSSYRNGRCIAILFKSVGVRGQFDSPDQSRPKHGMYFLHLVSRCGHHCMREADMATPLQLQQLVGCKIICFCADSAQLVKKHRNLAFKKDMSLRASVGVPPL